MASGAAWKLAAGAAAGVAVAVGFRAGRPGRGTGAGAAASRRTYRRAVTVNRSPSDVYAFWRDPSNLGQVLDRVTRVERLGDDQTRWVVAGPLGREIEFTAQLMADEPGRLVAWRSTDSPVAHAGRAEFGVAPGGRGTELRVGLTYAPPAGAPGATIAALSGDEPDRWLRDALRRIKQILEGGELLRVEGQPSGRGPLQERITQAVAHRVATGGRP
jgi:uncharacterized membrane protein